MENLELLRKCVYKENMIVQDYRETKKRDNRISRIMEKADLNTRNGSLHEGVIPLRNRGFLLFLTGCRYIIWVFFKIPFFETVNLLIVLQGQGNIIKSF